MPYLTPSQAAASYGVHPKTLVRWADSGLVRTMRTPGGHRRYCQDSLEQAMNAANTEAEVDRAAIRRALRSAA